MRKGDKRLFTGNLDKFLKKSHIVTHLAKERALVLKLMTFITFNFFGRLTVILLFYSVSGNANSMDKTLEINIGSILSRQ
jgi:hypothetical protein